MGGHGGGEGFCDGTFDIFQCLYSTPHPFFPQSFSCDVMFWGQIIVFQPPRRCFCCFYFWSFVFVFCLLFCFLFLFLLFLFLFLFFASAFFYFFISGIILTLISRLHQTRARERTGSQPIGQNDPNNSGLLLPELPFKNKMVGGCPGITGQSTRPVDISPGAYATYAMLYMRWEWVESSTPHQPAPYLGQPLR